MQEIRCPKCGEVFQVDETGYDQIAQQVRDKEFEKELERRKSELNAKHEQSLEIIRLQEEKEYNANIAQKDAEIFSKDQKISELQAKLNASETEKRLAISAALEKKNEEHSKATREYTENLTQKETELFAREQKIAELQAKLDVSETAKKLAVAEELVHFLYPNHSKHFYAFLSNYMPDWKERKLVLDQDVVHGL